MVPGVFGAIIGIFGTLISRGADILEKRTEDNIQLELAKSNERIAQLELEKAKVAGQVEVDMAREDSMREQQTAIEQAQSALMEASMSLTAKTDKADTSTFGTMIRAGIRPILTVLYSAAFLYVVWVATTPEIIIQQADAIFFAFIDTAVAITLWWFGIRKGSDNRRF